MNSPSSDTRSRCSAAKALLLALGALLLLAGPARAQYFWNGDDYLARGNMSYDDNWTTNSYIPNNGSSPYILGFGNDLQFEYNVNSETSIYDDFGSWENVNNILFDSSFSAPGNAITWNTGGNGIDFQTKLENDWTGTVTINTPLSGGQNGASHIELNAVDGGIVLNAAVYNDNNESFFAYGSNSNTLTVNTGLTGNSTDTFTLASGAGSGYGIVKFTAAQTWGSSSNGVNVTIGELWMDVGGSLDGGAAPITVGGNDTNTAKLWLSSVGTNLSLADPITVNNSSGSPAQKTVGGLNTSGTDTFSGTVTLNGQVNLSAATGGAVNFTNVISGASQNVVVNGYQSSFSGIIDMSASNTYSGSTYISGGTLQFNSGGSANSSPNFYLGETSGLQTATLTLGATGGGQTLNNPITVRGGSTGVKTISSLASSGTDTLGGGITMGASLTVSSTTGGTLALPGSITSGTSAEKVLTLANTGAVSISGAIGGGTGVLDVTQNGTGTTTLSNSNSYTGPTTVNAGALVVTGSLAGTGSASLAAGGTLEVDGMLNNSATTTLNNGTLQGDGSTGPITANGGTVAPGLTTLAARGTLTAAGAVMLSSTTTFSIRIGMVSGLTGDSDQLALSSGSVTLNDATLQLSLGSFINGVTDLDDTYVIINGGAGSTGVGSDIFAGDPEGSLISAGGQQFTIDYASAPGGGGLGSGNDVVLEIVPEPATWTGLAFGAIAIAAYRGRRRALL